MFSIKKCSQMPYNARFNILWILKHTLYVAKKSWKLDEHIMNYNQKLLIKWYKVRPNSEERRNFRKKWDIIFLYWLNTMPCLKRLSFFLILSEPCNSITEATDGSSQSWSFQICSGTSSVIPMAF